MRLDSENGSFFIGDKVINEKEKLDDFKEAFAQLNIEQWVSRGDLIIFRILEYKGLILLIGFYDNIVEMIDIYVDKEFYLNIEDVLWMIGGANRYAWGKVELCFDPRKQNESIIISYNNRLERWGI